MTTSDYARELQFARELALAGGAVAMSHYRRDPAATRNAMVEPELSEWGVAALQPIVTEAGGRLTHIGGAPWSGQGSCLTTCGSIHQEVVALARPTTPALRG
jgi:fructose-1,6-bisphosphatase/inositol monophosphatase family enzyme